ncbi:hypothetical protein Dimus_003623 [Dionaea muscipula]
MRLEASIRAGRVTHRELWESTEEKMANTEATSLERFIEIEEFKIVMAYHEQTMVCGEIRHLSDEEGKICHPGSGIVPEEFDYEAKICKNVARGDNTRGALPVDKNIEMKGDSTSPQEGDMARSSCRLALFVPGNMLSPYVKLLDVKMRLMFW